MRKLAITLVPLFLVACTGEPTAPDPARLSIALPADDQSVSTAANGADRFTIRFDVSFDDILSPSDFPCLTEAIHEFGSYEQYVNSIVSQGSRHITVHQSTNNVTVIGMTTGDIYQYEGPLTYTASGYNDGGGPLEFTVHNINHYVGPGADGDIYFRTLLHVTFDATTGEPTVVVDKNEVLCH
jgi:hypothetical protein